MLGEFRGTKVALKRALKSTGNGSKHGSSKRLGSRSNKKRKSPAPKKTADTSDSASLAGLSVDSGEIRSVDPELGGAISDLDSKESSHAMIGEHQSSSKQHSLGFLRDNFGHKSTWAGMFRWKKADNFPTRFKEVILGDSKSGSVSLSSKSWHAVLCPWFNSYAQAELEFIQEVRRKTTIVTYVCSFTPHVLQNSRCAHSARSAIHASLLCWVLSFLDRSKPKHETPT